MKSIVYIVFLFCLFPIYTQSQSIEPSNEEQFMLERINYARMNPAEEGIRLANTADPDILSAYKYFNVDKAKIITDFATYPARPPLAFNPLLTSSARKHSQDMRDNNFQDHTGSDGSTVSTRITATGYKWRAIGENIYSYGKSVEYSHAGFVVDWGVSSLGHRENTLEYNDKGYLYQDVGIGIMRTASAKVMAKTIFQRFNPVPPGMKTWATNPVGPMIVTIDFGTPQANSPKVLGVVYQDINKNQFYDEEEGFGGVKIQLDGTSFSTVTTSSGGYTLPVNKPGNYTITASGGALPSPVQKSVSVGYENVKADFNPSTETTVEQWNKM